MSRMLRANLVVASGTAASRITGLLRTTTTMYVLGSTLLSDAYLLANDTPNIVYDLLLGGVLSATLVPLFTSYLNAAHLDDDDERFGVHAADHDSTANRGTNVIITVAVTLIVALTLIAVALAPQIFGLYSRTLAAGVDAAEYRAAGTALTRIFLVQILFYGLTGIGNAYLNSRRRFVAAAWSPVVANVVIIAAMLSLPGAGSREWAIGEVLTNSRLRWTLGLGATLGIATMAVIVVVAVFRAGLKFRPDFDFGHPAVRTLAQLSGWTFGFVAANQVAVLVIRNLLQQSGRGDVSAYIYAFVFFMLPHGLLAVSVSTTFQPELARAVRNRNADAFTRQFSLGVRSIAALTLPAAVLLLVLASSVMELFRRGNFNAAAVDQAATALRGFSIGLAAFSVYQFVLRGFYAHHDSRTPFVLNVVENAINIGLAFLVVDRYGLGGLAASYGAAYIISVVFSLFALKRKVPAVDLGEIGRSALRLAAAATVLGGVAFVAQLALPTDGRLGALITLTVASSVGLAAYVAALTAMRAPEVAALRRFLPSG